MNLMADNSNDRPEGIKLQAYLARAGLGSRRRCEDFIAEGRVAVNGEVVRHQGIRITDEEVSFDGRLVYQTRKHVYIALNKPVRCVCTSSDPEGRPTAVDLVRNAWPGRIYNVGRLDYMSSGLLFLTNDGDFTRRMTHPSAGIPKTYLVETRENIETDMLLRWKQGTVVEGVRYRIDDFTLKNPRRVLLTLKEGKNREIRKLFGSERFKIRRLHRVSIGPVSVNNLKPGEYRFLNSEEVSRLLDSGVKTK